MFLLYMHTHGDTRQSLCELASKAEAQAAVEDEAEPVAPSVNRNKGNTRKQWLSENFGGGSPIEVVVCAVRANPDKAMKESEGSKPQSREAKHRMHS
jgi:hypothetical protein